MINQQTQTPQNQSQDTVTKRNSIRGGLSKLGNQYLVKHIALGIFFFGGVLIFSVAMSIIAVQRNSISRSNYQSTAALYNGEIEQKAPMLGISAPDSAFLNNFRTKYSQTTLKHFAENTNIVKTDAKVKIIADFVKMGLEYQPTFETEFVANYVLKNSLDTAAIINFEFPFPFTINNNEISNVKLFVGDEEIENPKAKVQVGQATNSNNNTRLKTVDGLRWEGELEPQEEINIRVSYNTVGISSFSYQGFGNNIGAQDFKLDLDIVGTKAYNVRDGLSVDDRIFGDKTVKIVWDKTSLFSTPEVNVAVASRLSPGSQVSRIYAAMSPIYAVLMVALIALSIKNKKLLAIKDMFIVTFLFVLYFPLVHYLVSFTIDPTMEIYANYGDVGFYSLGLYPAFAIALFTIVGLITYLFAKVYGAKFSFGSVLPICLVCLGFFPLAMTIPEYAILLALLGLTALSIVLIKQRLATTD